MLGMTGCPASSSYSVLCRIYNASGTCPNGNNGVSVPYYVDSTGKYALLYIGTAARSSYFAISPASAGCSSTSFYAYFSALAVAQVTNSQPALWWTQASSKLMVYSTASAGWASYSTLYPTNTLTTTCYN